MFRAIVGGLALTVASACHAGPEVGPAVQSWSVAAAEATPVHPAPSDPWVGVDPALLAGSFEFDALVEDAPRDHDGDAAALVD
jgi:hypothetical protein